MTTADGRPAPGAGLFSHMGEVFSALAQYLRARARLAGIESREAIAHYLWIAIYLLAALTALAFGYVFLLISLVFVIEHLTGLHWGWLLLAIAVAHFVAMIACALVAKGKFSQPMFQTTLAELKRDQEWLQKPTTGHN